MAEGQRSAHGLGGALNPSHKHGPQNIVAGAILSRGIDLKATFKQQALDTAKKASAVALPVLDVPTEPWLTLA